MLPQAGQKYVFKAPYKRILASIIDFFGAILFLPVRLKKAQFKPDSVKRILVLRLDHIGDLVLTRPALEALRKRYPEARIDWLLPAEYEKLFRTTRSVSSLIPFGHNWFSRNFRISKMLSSVMALRSDIRQRKYDLAIDFRGDIRNIVFLFSCGIPWRFGYGITGGSFLLTHPAVYPSGVHQAQVCLSLLAPLGISTEVSVEPFAYQSQTAESLKASFPDIFAAPSLVMIHPGGGYADKIWGFEKFKILFKKLLAEGHQLLLIGTQKEKETYPFEDSRENQFFDLRGQVNLHELPILMEKCRLFIGCDSGPAHIAASQGIPMISIFSDFNPIEVWKPLSPKATIVHGDIKKITVDEIFEPARKILSDEASRK